MIRLLLAFLLAPLLIGAAPAKDWTRTVNRTAAGAYVIGNPAAKVRLVEYLSYTCSHCADYSADSTSVLKNRYVRSGSTRVEFRHATRDKIDLAATIVARCAGPAGFAGIGERLFATQNDWYARGSRFEQVNAARISVYSENAKLQVIAEAAGLNDIARARGISDAALKACFDNDAAILQVAVMSDASWRAIDAAAAPQPGGTPSFVVNGKPYASLDWAGLDKILRAAGAR